MIYQPQFVPFLPYIYEDLFIPSGRRHQLRYHCFKGLGASIVGDWDYGFKGLQGSTAARRGGGGRDSTSQIIGAGLGEAWWANYGEPAIGTGRPRGTLWRGAARGAIGDGGGQQASSPPIMLHSREVLVATPLLTQGGGPMRVIAPVPPYMAAVMKAFGWDPQAPTL